MLKYLVVLFILLSTLGVGFLPVKAYGFFEAGNQSNWPITIDGLSAVIDSSSWKLAPDSYSLGQTLSPKVVVTNSANQTVSKNVYAYVSKVEESPIGNDISNGNQSLTDEQLDTNEQANNNKQDLPVVYNIGTITLAPGQSTTITANFTPSSVGYYQIDFSTLEPGNGFQHGYIFAAGFSRILNGQTLGQASINAEQGGVLGASSLADTGKMEKNVFTVLLFLAIAGTFVKFVLIPQNKLSSKQ